MIVYDFKTKRIQEVDAEGYDPLRHQKTSEMSQRQRQMIINHYIKVSVELAHYLERSTTNRIKLVKEAMESMVTGKLPLNIVVLMVLLADVEHERRWRLH